jgi:hypothetical protein
MHTLLTWQSYLWKFNLKMHLRARQSLKFPHQHSYSCVVPSPWVAAGPWHTSSEWYGEGDGMLFLRLGCRNSGLYLTQLPLLYLACSFLWKPAAKLSATLWTTKDLHPANNHVNELRSRSSFSWTSADTVTAMGDTEPDSQLSYVWTPDLQSSDSVDPCCLNLRLEVICYTVTWAHVCSHTHTLDYSRTIVIEQY